MAEPFDSGEHGGGSGLEKSLTKGRIGGMPIWAVAVMMAAGLIVFLYIRNKNKATAGGSNQSGTTDSTSLVGTDGSSSGSAIGDYLNADPTNPAYPVGLSPQGVPAPVTNTQWSRLALDELISKGDDPTLVANALSTYLSGGTLDAAAQAIINQALQLFGAPPEGIIPVNTQQPVTVPGAVTGLRATEWGTDHASFSFTPVPGATSYDITQPNGQTRSIGAATDFTVGGALGGNVHYPYTQQVRAVNSAGTGPWASTTIQSSGGTH